MQGNPQVIEALRAAIVAEAHLNVQYRTDWRSMKFAGLNKLAKVLDDFGDDAHCWVKAVQDRCLFLGGDIGYSMPPVVEQKNGVMAVFQADLTLEMAIVRPYENAVQASMAAFDDTTRNLFEHLLKWHQKHVGWLEQQLRLMEAIGESEYIAEKL